LSTVAPPFGPRIDVTSQAELSLSPIPFSDRLAREVTGVELAPLSLDEGPFGLQFAVTPEYVTVPEPEPYDEALQMGTVGPTSYYVTPHDHRYWTQLDGCTEADDYVVDRIDV
jgi:hypothetical protein